jgi:hypothetical protein
MLLGSILISKLGECVLIVLAEDNKAEDHCSTSRWTRQGRTAYCLRKRTIEGAVRSAGDVLEDNRRWEGVDGDVS